jgi:hypothetical protein
MKLISSGTEDQAWIRDQTARIFHRHILAGKHFRLDAGALLARIAQLRDSVDAEPVLRKAA